MSLQARVGLSLGELRLDIDLGAEQGAAVAVVGPNGAGKTTLLRAIAGLVALQRGRVLIDGTLVEDPARRVRLPPEDRRLGVMFQQPRLFTHLTAVENVAFGLRARGIPRAAAVNEALTWLDRVGVADLAAHRATALSGGQAQRVALARALVTQPSLLLLDEPLAAVDASARDDLRRLLRTELRRYPGARLLITHDPVEAAALADHLVVVEGGQVSQQGPLAEVTARPRTPWVATMVGLNLLQGTATGTTVQLPTGGRVVTSTASFGPAFIAFRPNTVTLHRRPPEGSARNAWPGHVSDLSSFTHSARIRILGPVPLVAEVTLAAVADLGLGDGGPIWASVEGTDIDVYPA